ncbi:MAG: hypothetical protein AAF739_14580 [Pseudomonadota bacterium]
MTINSVSRNSANTDLLLSMRAELDVLQRQLGTGQRAQSYAELGESRLTSINTRAELASIDAYQQTIGRTEVTLSIMSDTLSRLDDLALEVKEEALTTSLALDDGVRTAAQIATGYRMEDMVAMLNTDIDGRYLFSGLSADTEPVAPPDVILDGEGGQAGLRQVMAERLEADLGGTLADSPLSGRLALGVGGTTVSLADTASGPFGFALDVASGASSSSPNLTTAVLPGPPASLDLTVTGSIDVGETVRFTLSLPDGTTENVTLMAAETRQPGDRSFVVDGDNLVTAANIQAALEDVIDELARTELAAASAEEAGKDFFDNDPPLRVDPDPALGLAGASAQVADPAGTVSWYRGEDGPVDARLTATARIDDGQQVRYGARANEDALRTILRETAVFTAFDFSLADDAGTDRYQAMAGRTRDNLDDPTGGTLPRAINVEVGTAGSLLASTDERLTSTRALLQTILDDTDGVSQEEVATRILNLQTRLEASYSVTAILQDLSLVNFLR